MADVASLRITGPVLRAKPRNFVSKSTGLPVSLTILTVFVGNSTTDVTIFNDNEFVKESGIPVEGDIVDLAVDVKKNNYGINITASDIWSSSKVPA